MKLDGRRRRLLERTFLDYQQTSAFMEHPFIVKRAHGLHYWDTDGKRYFDGIGGIFVASLGHGHPRVLEAMRRQAETLGFAPPMHGLSDVALDFVEKLSEVTPENLNFVKSYSGGVRSGRIRPEVTRQYFRQSGHPGKYKFISRYFGYHGATFGAMAASGRESARRRSNPRLPDS